MKSWEEAIRRRIISAKITVFLYKKIHSLVGVWQACIQHFNDYSSQRSGGLDVPLFCYCLHLYLSLRRLGWKSDMTCFLSYICILYMFWPGSTFLFVFLLNILFIGPMLFISPSPPKLNLLILFSCCTVKFYFVSPRKNVLSLSVL